MQVPRQAANDIVELLKSERPGKLLLAGADAALNERICATLKDAQVIDGTKLLAQLDHLPVYDVIVIIGLIEQFDEKTANIVIGRLRDLHSRHLFLLARTGDWPDQASHWQRNDLLAHGFTLLQHYDDGAGHWHLCRYELDTYKATPDWLNSKYWANPELFGKYRW